MTPGQEALAEAMRIEQARIYGSLSRETKSVTEIEPAEFLPLGVVHIADDDLVEAAIADGASNAEVMNLYGLTYSQAREARKRVMKEAI